MTPKEEAKYYFDKMLEENDECTSTEMMVEFSKHSNFSRIQILKAQIKVLSEHITHPKKPGYMRHDILDKIEDLQKEINNYEKDLHKRV